MIENRKLRFMTKWIKCLLDEMKERDQRSIQHAFFVALQSSSLARMMQMSTQFQASVFIAGLLHDYGMLEVPISIIETPEKLTKEQFEVIKMHPLYGYEIVRELSVVKKYGIDEMILHHHERIDGLGYPDGCKNDEFSLGAKIIGVVAAYSAMMSQRPFKALMTHTEAVSELAAYRGTQFDSRVVDLFAAKNERELSERCFDEVRQDELVRSALSDLLSQTKQEQVQPIRVYSDVHKDLRSLLIWNGLLDSAQNSIEAQDILRAVQPQVEKLVRFDRLGVLLARQDDTFCTIHEIVTREGLTPAPNGMLMTVEQSGLEFLAHHKRTYVAGDIASRPEFNEDHYLASIGVRSIIRLPLMKGDSVYGIMTFKSMERDAFSENDIQIAEGIAKVLATNIYNAKLLNDLRNQAERDGMTGLYNRRFLNALLAQEGSPFKDPSGTPVNGIGLLIVDVCDFKGYNDTFGHVAGDERLRDIAALLDSVVLENAFTIRYGGDEFVIIYSGGDQNLEERILERVDQYNLNIQDGLIPLNLSVGSSFGDWKEINSLIMKADSHMYQQKQRICEKDG